MPPFHSRKQNRLRNYDYSQPGMYFITLCVQHKRCLLGEISEGKMQLNAAGEMVSSIWSSIPDYYPNIGLDVFVIMPNHIHGLVSITCENAGGNCGETTGGYGEPKGRHGDLKGRHRDLPLRVSDVVRDFKSLTTRLYIKGVHADGWFGFDKRLWQRNYYDHILRNEQDLQRIREYIQNNPQKWHEDTLFTPHTFACDVNP